MDQVRKLCFVISPIGEASSPERLRSDQVFRHMIKPIVESMGYEVDRADLITTPGVITNQIIERLLESDLVVADLTDHNPNVFYELALRHAFGKPVIPILKIGQRIPFDNNQVRTIFYDHNDLDSVEDCKEEIRKHIASIEAGEVKLSNPVTSTIELEKLKESIDPETRQTGEILDLLADLKQDVKNLKEPRYERTSSEAQVRIIPFLAAVEKLEFLRDGVLDWSESLAGSDDEIEEPLQNLRREVSGKTLAVLKTLEDSIKVLDVDSEMRVRMSQHVIRAVKLARKYRS